MVRFAHNTTLSFARLLWRYDYRYTMKYIVLILAVFLASCATKKSNYSEDYRISKMLVGSWDYTAGPEKCREYGFIGFRGSGEYTRSSEDCQMADDSFGQYYYGWYVADKYICFVSTKEHLAQVRTLGFIKDHCHWKVVEYSEDGFLIHDYWWGLNNEDDEFEIIKIFKPSRS